MTHDSRSPPRWWLGQYSDSDPGNYKGLEPICLHSTMLPLYPKYHNDDSQKTQSMNSFSRLNKSVSHVAVIVAGGRGGEESFCRVLSLAEAGAGAQLTLAPHCTWSHPHLDTGALMPPGTPQLSCEVSMRSQQLAAAARSPSPLV